jgi:hypothetical protein
LPLKTSDLATNLRVGRNAGDACAVNVEPTIYSKTRWKLCKLWVIANIQIAASMKV